MFDHQFTDTEYIGTARPGGVRPVHGLDRGSNMHFLAGKSDHDATYERAYAELAADEATAHGREGAVVERQPVVILGGGGFIGSNLARRYLDQGRTVLAVDQEFPDFRLPALGARCSSPVTCATRPRLRP